MYMSMNNKPAPRHLSLLLLAYVLLASSASAGPKDEIALFKYQGAVEGQTSFAKFENFRGILEDKVLSLQNEVFRSTPPQDKNLEYLKKIHIGYRNQDRFSGQDEVNKWMKNESNVLILLKGTIISDDNINYIVRSHVYLGDLKEYAATDVVTLNLPVKISEFGNTRDSHTCILLYALAMDAKRQGYPKEHVALFLKTAKNRMADLKRRTGKLSPGLVALETMITKATAELLGGDDASH